MRSKYPHELPASTPKRSRGKEGSPRTDARRPRPCPQALRTPESGVAVALAPGVPGGRLARCLLRACARGLAVLGLHQLHRGALRPLLPAKPDEPSGGRVSDVSVTQVERQVMPDRLYTGTMRSRVDEDPRVRNERLTRPGMPSLAGLSATATCILVLLVASRLGTGNTALSLPPLPPISASMEDLRPAPRVMVSEQAYLVDDRRVARVGDPAASQLIRVALQRRVDEIKLLRPRYVDDVEQRDVMIVAAGDTPFGVVQVAVTAAIASGCTHLALVTRAEI